MKVIVFGLDGVSYDFIQKWKEELPNINKMMNKGTFGLLKSTYVPISASAWTSITTGKSPAEHGVFDNFQLDENKELIINTALSSSNEHVWDILSKFRYTSGIYFMPLTYPPKKINGYMISGQPALDTNNTYPLDLESYIKNKFPDFKLIIETVYNGENERECLDSLNRLIDIKLEIFTDSLENRKCDFNFFVLEETDWLNHYFFRFFDPQHYIFDKEKAERYVPEVISIYKKIDNFIGVSMKYSDYVFLISDHGNGPVNGIININKLLYDSGMIKLKKNFKVGLKYSLLKLGITKENIYKLVKKSKVYSKFAGVKVTKNKALDFFINEKDIDYIKTKAYCFGHYGQLYINKKYSNKEYLGALESVEKLISSIKNPLTDEPLDIKFYRKDLIFIGKNSTYAPDLVFEIDNFHYVTPPVFELSPFFQRIRRSKSGDHNRDGIFLAYGKNIKGCVIQNAVVEDITPTLLHCFGIGDSFNGKILKIFKKSMVVSKKNKKLAKLNKIVNGLIE